LVWLADEQLQAIAAENNLAETAFVVPHGQQFRLRWFTPEIEVDLCGHATLAAAHVLYRHLHFHGDAIRFETRSGEVTVARDGDRLTLNFPSRPARECHPPQALLDGLRCRPQFVGKSRDYLVVLEHSSAVKALAPEAASLARLDALGIIVTAPGEPSATGEPACDFVSRFFAPAAGVPEDPVTGSAHCTLIPYWAARLNKETLRAVQVSKRGGELFCRLQGDRVLISGRAQTYATGFLQLP
jgi:PhzF family phenazine biosynthesis protein